MPSLFLNMPEKAKEMLISSVKTQKDFRLTINPIVKFYEDCNISVQCRIWHYTNCPDYDGIMYQIKWLQEIKKTIEDSTKLYLLEYITKEAQCDQELMMQHAR